MESKEFAKAKAKLDVIRYEECDRIFDHVRALEEDVKREWDDEPLRHKYEDRDRTHKEVYLMALNEVQLLLDARLGQLGGG